MEIGAVVSKKNFTKGITACVIIFLAPAIYCSRSNAWCSGAERDRDGNVRIDDLATFADEWLLF
jgi:hypothetical protein